VFGGLYLNEICKNDGKITVIGVIALTTSCVLGFVALVFGLTLTSKDGFVAALITPAILAFVGIFLVALLIVTIGDLIKNRKANKSLIAFPLILVELIILFGVMWWLLTLHLSNLAVTSC